MTGNLEEVTDSALMVIYIIIALIGAGGNLLVIVVMVWSREMRKKITNQFIIHQSAIDVMSSVLLALSLTVKNYDMSHLSPFVAEIVCRFWLTRMLLWSSIFASTYNLVGITVERYMKIVFPIKHKVLFSNRVAYGMMVAAWIIGIAWGVLPNVLSSGVVDGYCYQFYFWPSIAAQKVQGIGTMVFLFMIPLLLFIYGYSHIIYVLYRKPASIASGVGVGNQGTDNIRTKALRKLVKMLIFVSVCFVACWVLNHTLFLLFNLNLWMEFGGPLYHLSTVLAFMNCSINPFIYATTYDEFRRNFKKLACRGQVADQTEGWGNTDSTTLPQ